MTESYAGWTNRSTWVIGTQLQDQEALYQYWIGRARDSWLNFAGGPPEIQSNKALLKLAEELREHFEQQLQQQLQQWTADAGCPHDWRMEICHAALEEVNWQELAETFLLDMRAYVTWPQRSTLP